MIVKNTLLLLLNNYNILRLFDAVIIFESYHYFNNNIFNLFYL